MGRLKHYRNCEVVIAPEEEPLKYAVGCEDEMVHQELKCCNAHNEIGKQNNGKRFLTDREIKSLVEQFVKDDDIIAQTYDEIAKRRKDKDFKYSLVKQGVSMTIVSRFCEMGIARPSAMKLAMGVVNILYDLYVADCQTKTEKKESKVIEEIVEAVPSVSEAIEETQEEPAPAGNLKKNQTKRPRKPQIHKKAMKRKNLPQEAQKSSMRISEGLSCLLRALALRMRSSKQARLKASWR